MHGTQILQLNSLIFRTQPYSAITDIPYLWSLHEVSVASTPNLMPFTTRPESGSWNHRIPNRPLPDSSPVVVELYRRATLYSLYSARHPCI